MLPADSLAKNVVVAGSGLGSVIGPCYFGVLGSFENQFAENSRTWPMSMTCHLGFAVVHGLSPDVVMTWETGCSEAITYATAPPSNPAPDNVFDVASRPPKDIEPQHQHSIFY